MSYFTESIELFCFFYIHQHSYINHFFSILISKSLYITFIPAWNDIRTDSTVDAILAKIPDRNKNYFKNICGLPISPYFSALKMRWLKDNVKAVRRASRDKRLLFGTVDTWIVWVSVSN